MENKEKTNLNPGQENQELESHKKSVEDIKRMMDDLEKKLDQITIPMPIEDISREKSSESKVEEEDNPQVQSEEKSENTPQDTSKEETDHSSEDSKTEETTAVDEEVEEKYNPLEDDTESPAPEKKHHYFRNSLIALIILLGIAYAGATYYFESHFFYHTIVWGQDCSFKTVDEVKELVKGSIAGYEIQLTERDNQIETLTAEGLGLDLLNDGTIEGLLDSQKSYMFITSLWEEFDYQQSVNLNLSDEKLEQAVMALNAEQKENIAAPENAYYKYSKEDEKYIIVPEVEGNTINNDILIPKLKEAILSKSKTFDFESCGAYVEPEIRKDDEHIVKASTSLNEYMKTNIVYDFGDRKETVGPKLLHKWLSVNDKDEAVLNKKKVKEFVTKLAEKYDTVGKKRKFKSVRGNTIKVSGGTYGWTINQDKEYEKLLKLIKKHKQTTREPEYSHIAKCRDKNDLGKTYIEIDLSKQHLWYYKNGKTVVSTPVVTGDETKGRGTPTGVYYILYKQTDHVLRGQGYASHVDFWMPFIGDRGIGIHDASWRGSYGGNIFYGNGSHGCVNTPRSAVAEIFYSIPATYPVVVHW